MHRTTPSTHLQGCKGSDGIKQWVFYRLNWHISIWIRNKNKKRPGCSFAVCCRSRRSRTIPILAHNIWFSSSSYHHTLRTAIAKSKTCTTCQCIPSLVNLWANHNLDLLPCTMGWGWNSTTLLEVLSAPFSRAFRKDQPKDAIEQDGRPGPVFPETIGQGSLSFFPFFFCFTGLILLPEIDSTAIPLQLQTLFPSSQPLVLASGSEQR